jgi:hypothetical protein
LHLQAATGLNGTGMMACSSSLFSSKN